MFKLFLPILPLATAALLSLGVFHGVASERAAHEKKERRMKVIEAGRTGELASLEAARADREPLVRRAAARALGRIGKPALPLLEAYAFGDNDALTRRIALRGALKHLSAADQLVWLERAGNDASEWVRISAIEALAAVEPRTPEATALLQAAQDDPSEEVSLRASQLLWPFHEEVASVRDRPEFRDLALSGGHPLPLPAEGWKFQADRTGAGHLQQWQSPPYDES